MNWMTIRRYTMAALVGGTAFSLACTSFDDEATGEEPEEDAGVLDVTSGDDVGTSDVAEEPQGPTNLITGDYVEPPTCDDSLSMELPFTIEGCSYSYDPPRWQLPQPNGAGIQNLMQSCAQEGSSPEPFYVHPNFQAEDADGNAAILWQTDFETRYSDVRIGTDPDNLDMYVRGWSFEQLQLNQERLVHEAHLCGLRDNTTYYYQVGGGETWSDVFSFTTAPEYLSDEPFTFAVTGDTRSETQALWGQALEEIEQQGADFLVFTGDAVASGYVQEQWDTWWDQGQATETSQRLAGLPLIYAHGNHDLVGDAMWSMLANPANEQNYYIRYGNALFFVFDDTGFLFGTNEFLDTTVRPLMRQAFEEHPDVTWRFVANHRPFVSASTRHGSQQDLQEELMPIIDEFGVDMVFNGHDHLYERSCPISNIFQNPVCRNDGAGTVYTISAGIGAPLYDPGRDWWTQEAFKTPTYMIIEIDGNSLNMTAYDLDGVEVDSYSITKD